MYMLHICHIHTYTCAIYGCQIFGIYGNVFSLVGTFVSSTYLVIIGKVEDEPGCVLVYIYICKTLGQYA